MQSRFRFALAFAAVVAALCVAGSATPAAAPTTTAKVLVRRYLVLLTDGKVLESCRYWSPKVYALNADRKDSAGIEHCASISKRGLDTRNGTVKWTVGAAELLHPGLVVVHTVVAGGPHDFFVRQYGARWFLDTPDITSA
jgi:hypothetical protein